MKLKVLVITLLCVALLTVSAGAEYIACTSPNQEHTFSEWATKEATEAGEIIERTCSTCGYVQSGFKGEGAAEGIVATTMTNPIITTASNPQTGARI